MKLDMLKCHGSGNDFVLIDETEGLLFSEDERRVGSKLLCDRAGVVGADGVLFVQSSESADVRMRMFNADGSEAQTCGNGLRCVARYAAEKLRKSKVSVETMKGVSVATREAEISPGVATYAVELGPISLSVSDLPLIIEDSTLIDAVLPQLDESYRFTAISAPNPHLVARVDWMDRADLKRVGELAAKLPALLPERANVSFFQVIDSQSLAVSTFERGSGLTLSCGSAMGASSLAACLAGYTSWDAWLTVFNLGGFIQVRANQDVDEFYRVTIRGNATNVFSASIDLDLSNNTLCQFFRRHAFADEMFAYAGILDAAERMMKNLPSRIEEIARH